MQDKERRVVVTKIDLDVVKRYLNKIFEMYECEDNLQFLSNKEIFMFTSEFSVIAVITKSSHIDDVLNKLSSIGLFPYALGEPIIMISNQRKVRPLLPLSRYLVNICKNKLVLDEKLAEVLTYNKSIVIRERIKQGRYLALDKNGYFIAYVVVKREKDKSKIIPELDIGWYLRKGG